MIEAYRLRNGRKLNIKRLRNLGDVEMVKTFVREDCEITVYNFKPSIENTSAVTSDQTSFILSGCRGGIDKTIKGLEKLGYSLKKIKA